MCAWHLTPEKICTLGKYWGEVEGSVTLFEGIIDHLFPAELVCWEGGEAEEGREGREQGEREMGERDGGVETERSHSYVN